MDAEINYWYLKNHDLFAGLSDADLVEISQYAEYKKAKREEIIYFTEPVIDRLYFLLQGRVKIAYFVEEEEEVVVEILKEGDMFGEIGLQKAVTSYTEFAQVLSDEVVICSIPISKFETVLQKKPQLAITYVKKLGEKLKTISTKFSDVIFKDVRSRVITFFLQYSKYEGKWNGNEVEIKMFLTHKDIAKFTASSRQKVSTIINMLEKENKIVYVNRNKLIIPDITKLN